LLSPDLELALKADGSLPIRNDMVFQRAIRIGVGKNWECGKYSIRPAAGGLAFHKMT
jgi:hypothetical protein